MSQHSKASGAAREIGIGMVGYAFMGRAHSHAWHTVARAFPDVPLAPRLAAVCGRDKTAAQAAADRLGWASAETDWRALIERDDIDLIDISAPGDLHAPIAIAALEAGKHVLCEKPLANTLEEAEAMAAAARAAYPGGARSMVGFNYRRVPALALARKFVAEGRIGTLRHVRAVYLQDWLADPRSPMTWRMQAERAGSGALGDLGAHIVDMVQYVTGESIESVSGLLRTFVTERPVLGSSVGLSGTGGAERGPVTVDDAALFTGALIGGGVATFEATRMAMGRKNGLRFEISGTEGAIAFDLERLNELEFLDGTGPVAEQGFRRIVVTEPEHPYLEAWWPQGHVIGWEHTFTHQIRDFLLAIRDGAAPSPSFEEGLQVQRVLAAIEESAAAKSATVHL
jgi:predicted dehydrogenase